MEPHEVRRFASLDAQHRPLVLTLTPGMDGFRLAFAGCGRFDPVHGDDDKAIEFRSWAEAGAAYRAATLAGDQLAEIARGGRNIGVVR